MEKERSNRLVNPYLSSTLSTSSGGTTKNSLLSKWALDTKSSLLSKNNLLSSNLLTTTAIPDAYTSSLNLKSTSMTTLRKDLLTSNKLLSTSSACMEKKSSTTTRLTNELSREESNEGEVLKEYPEDLVDYTDLRLKLRDSETSRPLEFNVGEQSTAKQLDEEAKRRLKLAKIQLIRLASLSMLRQPNLMNANDVTRQALMETCDNVADNDPEFVLKVALYCRQELHVRSVSNFLLAYASTLSSCRCFLSKYFSASINLPSDWLETADFALSLASILPASLRKALVIKFDDFDEYQLAKYNKGGKTKKKKKKNDNDVDLNNEEEENTNKECKGIKKLTIKRLVRLLHISSPPNFVMAILGKEYPKSAEEYRSARLPGFFDPEKAGQRMKLATPLTWETQISTKGNLGSVWSSLITNRKLPYMALLRNLRNLSTVNLDSKVLKLVVGHLTNVRAVATSKLFPFRFFVAMEALKALKKELDEAEGYVGHEDRRRVALQKRLKANKTTVQSSKTNVDTFANAVEKAMSIATEINVPKMADRTLIICSLNYQSFSTRSSVQRGVTPIDYHVGHSIFLAAVMVASGCEHVEVWIVDERDWCFEVTNMADMDLSQLTKAVETMTSFYVENKQFQLNENLDQCLRRLRRRVAVDPSKSFTRCILVHADDDDQRVDVVENWANTMREEKDNGLMCFSMKVGEANTDKEESMEAMDTWNNVRLTGFSEAVFHCLKDCDLDQTSRVENIDRKFGLINVSRATKLAKTNLCPTISLKRRRVVKVFVSSTFVDMHGERDLMHFFVIPELVRRQRHLPTHLSVDIGLIDLRWGIVSDNNFNKKSFKHQRRILNACLAQVAEADIVVAFIGSRHGWKPDVQCLALDDPDEDKDLSSTLKSIFKCGMSLTELEVRFALHTKDKRNLLCFIRSDPDENAKWPEVFRSDPKSSHRLEILKQDLLNEGVVVVNQYKATFVTRKGLPIMTNLDDLALRLVENLDKSIRLTVVKDDHEEAEHVERFPFRMDISKTLMDRLKPMSELMNCINAYIEKKGGFIELSGPPGIGITSLLLKVLEKLVHRHQKVIMVPIFGQNKLDVLNQLNTQLKVLCGIKDELNAEDSDSVSLSSRVMSMLRWLGFNTPLAIVIILDGLESNKDISLDFLPQQPWPNNIIVVLSTHTASRLASQMTQRRQLDEQNSSVVRVGELTLVERKTFARDYLLRYYGKRLDESLLNDHLMSLIGKRSMGNVRFLKHILDNLSSVRYEELDKELEKVSDSRSVENLLETEIESEDKGLKSILLFLLLNCTGLKERHVFEISSRLGVNMHPINMAVVLNVLRKWQVVQVANDHLTLNMKDSDVLRVVKRFVMRVSRETRERIESNFMLMLKNELFNKSSVVDKHLLISIMEKCSSKSKEPLESVVCTVYFLYWCFILGLSSKLIRCLKMNSKSARAQSFLRFVQLNADQLESQPHLSVQIALNTDDELIVESAQQLLEDKDLKRRLNLPCFIIVRRVSKVAKNGLRSCRSFDRIPTCLCECPLKESNYLAIGMVNGDVIVVDAVSMKMTKSLLGHTAPITAMCYLSSLLVTGSKDGEMAVWEMEKGVRVYRSTGDKKCLSHIVTRNFNVVTVTFGGVLSLWDAKRYTASDDHYKHSGPINCVAFNPDDDDEVVVGDWGGRVVLVNIVHFRKMSNRPNLTQHSSSVRSVGFNGRSKTLLSGDVQGELRLHELLRGGLLRRLKLRDQLQCIRSLDENDEFLVVSKNGAMKTLELQSELQASHRLRVEGVVTALAVIDMDNDKVTVLTGFEDGQVALMSRQVVQWREKISDKSILFFMVKEHMVAVFSDDNHVHLFTCNDCNTSMTKVKSISLETRIIEDYVLYGSGCYGNGAIQCIPGISNMQTDTDTDTDYREVEDLFTTSLLLSANSDDDDQVDDQFSATTLEDLMINWIGHNTILSLSSEGHLRAHQLSNEMLTDFLRDYYEDENDLLWSDSGLNYLSVGSMDGNIIVLLAEGQRSNDSTKSSIVFIVKVEDDSINKQPELMRIFVDVKYGRVSKVLSNDTCKAFVCIHDESHVASVWNSSGTELAHISMSDVINTNKLTLHSNNDDIYLMWVDNDNTVCWVDVTKAMNETFFETSFPDDVSDLILMHKKDFAFNHEERTNTVALLNTSRRQLVVQSLMTLTNGESGRDRVVGLHRLPKTGSVISVSEQGNVKVWKKDETRLFTYKLTNSNDELFVKASIKTKRSTRQVMVALLSNLNKVYLAILEIRENKLDLVSLKSKSCEYWHEVIEVGLTNESKFVYVAALREKATHIMATYRINFDEDDVCLVQTTGKIRLSLHKMKTLLKQKYNFRHIAKYTLPLDNLKSQWYTCGHISEDKESIFLGDTSGHVTMVSGGRSKRVKMADKAITDLLLIEDQEVIIASEEGSIVRFSMGDEEDVRILGLFKHEKAVYKLLGTADELVLGDEHGDVIRAHFLRPLTNS